ncbi:unnamed protein product [Linum tenue]|uniref:O-methyltransferase C-terminal domain-containing protein n=1 Tax=Linum tenue TaxID=586396 RepID=A0AAV0R6G9_9ROSI|nr:unnamed protein product [Linum tenue]
MVIKSKTRTATSFLSLFPQRSARERDHSFIRAEKTQQQSNGRRVRGAAEESQAGDHRDGPRHQRPNVAHRRRPPQRRRRHLARRRQRPSLRRRDPLPPPSSSFFQPGGSPEPPAHPPPALRPRRVRRARRRRRHRRREEVLPDGCRRDAGDGCRRGFLRGLHPPAPPDVKHVGGDMFKSIPSGDAIFMKWALTAWAEEECKKVMENCYKALPQGGKLIVIEPVLPEKSDHSLRTRALLESDVFMMTLYRVKSKQKTEEEFKQLGLAVGFSNFRAFYYVDYFLTLMEFQK